VALDIGMAIYKRKMFDSLLQICAIAGVRSLLRSDRLEMLFSIEDAIGKFFRSLSSVCSAFIAMAP